MIIPVLQSTVLPTELPAADRLLATLAEFGMNIFAAIAILVIGVWVAKKIRQLFVKAMEKKGTDATVTGFVASMLQGALVLFVVIAAIGKLRCADHVVCGHDRCRRLGNRTVVAGLPLEFRVGGAAHSLQAIQGR